MRTTNKEFKSQVQEHILNALMEDDYLENDVTRQLQEVVNSFNNWYSPYEQKRTPNRQKAFIEFLSGLPSCIDLPYSYYEINDTLKLWFESCGMEYHEKVDYISTYYNLIYREFCTLCKKHEINF